MAGKPPVKRAKKEIAESSINGADENVNILATFMAKRQNVCESVAEFKFDKKRVRLISSNADISETCNGIAYWMWREQRVQGMDLAGHACKLYRWEKTLVFTIELVLL